MMNFDDGWNKVKQLPDWLYIGILMGGCCLLVVCGTIFIGFVERL